EYSNGEFLSLHNGCIDEVRPARSCHPFYTGDRLEEVVATWADETLAAIRPHAVSGGLRVAIDRLTLPCIRALEARGVELVFAQPLMERARLIKTADEIAAMRLACHSCDLIVAEMREALRPGMSEVELWSLLLLAFDTDLVGAYGMCVDISRTWLCGDGAASPAQRDIYARAVDSVESNIDLFRPGVSHREITEALVYPSVEEFNGYTVMAHGVGLCDEYPSIYNRESWADHGYDGVIEAGNVISVEAFVGRRDGGEGVKLEQQILVTDTGPELLSHAPLGLT
ncbi:MAG: M24 family metallopeptidase, partial [Ilumatobacteraceae bacterium]